MGIFTFFDFLVISEFRFEIYAKIHFSDLLDLCVPSYGSVSNFRGESPVKLIGLCPVQAETPKSNRESAHKSPKGPTKTL